ncbi:ferredoxin [Peterkaempfera bronchialis]|uniref:Ferredoxin n=1 Tax=Peterkaempfera bronchialis TaxID=2126346 RepID=A0A345T2W1_9ACTN|nr:ferredoxin [Peterkaempfera bronchialis]AXI80316.1 ferredoxin [Peterkaempfera bronchialis]
MEIAIDRDRCLGAGQCVLAAREVFDQDERDGLAFLLVERPADRLREAVYEARDTCPAGAVTVRED